MYKLKVRTIGEIIIKDDRLGKELLLNFQNQTLPKVIDINGTSFLSRLLEGVYIENHIDKKIYEYSDKELLDQAKIFDNKLKEAKKIKELDYSKNEVYPYHSNLLLHIYYVNNVIDNNNEDYVYRISFNKTTTGDNSISEFLKLDKQFLCLLELSSRYPEKYSKYCSQFFPKPTN